MSPYPNITEVVTNKHNNNTHTHTHTRTHTHAHTRIHTLIRLCIIEDCLYLDVYAPAGATPASNLPVMFFIYGGGFVFGDSYEFGFYDGKHIAKQHNVILVAANYRLSSFGFMALPQLMTESGTTGNYGVQDQRFALQWVQQNIRQFGGDPNRVTIFGESAGAMSVCYHVASPASAGLFHAAIVESGTASSPEFFVDYKDC